MTTTCSNRPTHPADSEPSDGAVKRALAEVHAPHDLDVVPDTWNVLPRTATRDELDVHWFFNWSEGEMSPKPLLNPWERQSLGQRVTANERPQMAEHPGVRRAASRSSRIQRVLIALQPENVSVLARWSAPPNRYPQSMRSLFGRLSAVAARTPAFDEIGGSAAFARACERAAAPRNKDGTENLLRHAAKVKLAAIREQAGAMLRAAFETYRAAKRAIDAEDDRLAAMRRARIAPAMTAVSARANNDPTTAEGPRALAQIMSAARGK